MRTEGARQLPSEPEPEAQPESKTELKPKAKPKPDRTVVLLGIVGVLLGAAVIAVGIEKGKSSSFDSTPATSDLTSSSPTPGSVAPTAAAADPSGPPTPAGDRRDDLPQGGLVKVAGRTLTQEQARGYLAQLHQVLGSRVFDTSDVDSDVLSIGAGICNDLDAGSTRAQEIDALRVVLEVAQVEANLYYSVAVRKLCVEAAPGAAGGNR